MNELLDQLLTYVRGIWRRRWLVVAVTCVLSLLGWITVALLPDKYLATARIYVDTRNVLGPLLSGVAVATDLKSDVDVLKQTLLSRPNLEELARSTGRDVETTNEIEQENLIVALRQATSLKTDHQGIFTIEFLDKDPVRAQQSVKTLIDMFVEQNLGYSREEMDTARRFIDAQIDYYEGQLVDAERQLANFKRDNLGLLPGPGGYDNRLEDAQADLRQVRADLQDTIAERDALESLIQRIPETISLQTGAVPGNSQPTGRTAQLIALKTQLANSLTRHTALHPNVIALKRQIEELESGGNAAANPNANEVTKGPAIADFGIPNPTYTELSLKLAEKQALTATLQRREKRHQDILNDLENKALTVPIIEAELAKLTRDYDVLQTKYENLISRRESAKITREQGATGEQVQFRIVEPPIVPAEPSSPSRPLLLSAVPVLGFAVGCGIAVVFTLIFSTYQSLHELRDDFDLPTLGAVTAIISGRKRTSLAVESLCLAGVSFILFSSYAGFMLTERQIGLGTLTKVVRETGSVDPAIELFNDKFALPEVVTERD